MELDPGYIKVKKKFIKNGFKNQSNYTNLKRKVDIRVCELCIFQVYRTGEVISVCRPGSWPGNWQGYHVSETEGFPTGILTCDRTVSEIICWFCYREWCCNPVTEMKMFSSVCTLNSHCVSMFTDF